MACYPARFVVALIAAGTILTACRAGTIDGEGVVSAELPTSAPEDEWARKRHQLVDRYIAGRDITDERVLDAMRTVPRHEHVPRLLRSKAYEDHPLPIGHDQTISQPYIVALMTQLLAVGPEDTVLEIGTGSGYQAAVLGKVAKEVHTIEIVQPLCEASRALLVEQGYDNVSVHCGDGYQGWPDAAPFAGIIVTAAPDHIPQPLVDQLAPGGNMVIPVGPAGWSQELKVLTKGEDGAVTERTVAPVAFVPMTGEAQGD